MNEALNVGIICNMGDQMHIREICTISMSNYYYAINNLFSSVKLINSAHDLNGIDILFLGNDHFEAHKQIWMTEEFINECNRRGIKVFVYSAENILNNVYPHNADIQRNLERFNFLHQRVIDPNDAITLNKKIARCMCSKKYESPVSVPAEKLNKCIFVGRMYDHRRSLINELKQTIEIDVVEAPINSWTDYMSVLAKYRFVLSPNSFIANSFHLKFYEALLVDSIPVHQVYDNTLEYYPVEAKYEDALFFKTAAEIPALIANCELERSFNKPWLEEELTEMFLQNDIII